VGLSVDEALGLGWCRVVHAEDLETLSAMQTEPLPAEGAHAVELRVIRTDGTRRHVSARTVPLRGDDGLITGFLGTLEDITDRKSLETRLEYDATHDRLTGLGSRALLVEELNSALARARRNGLAVALLFIDLDGFKRVNDMLGHAAGDELLVQVGQRLRHAVRDGDLCVRLGGDEFVVGCTDMVSIHTSTELGDRLLRAVTEPYHVHGHEVLVGASIGVATVQGDDPVSVDQLLSNADLAAYRAKRLGRGRVELFDEDLRRQLAQGRRIARAVAQLLDQPRLPILCRPIANLANGAIVGFDCAVDWESAGVHEVDAVARVVEDSGMSRSLDVAMVRTLLAQLEQWEQQPPGAIVPGLSMVLTRAGGISPLMAELVRDLLARTGVVPARCWIGVPESAVAQDFDAAAAVVGALDGLGVGVALRDFGSAISSLDQLRRLPAPTMTIAGALVAALRCADAARDDVHVSLFAAIVQYAQALGRVVLANDVEDAAHAERLREIGCDFGSGPAFGPPLRPDEISDFLRCRSL
jgi:diguanylate cyclase (GGDEF)-like protein/PAS domain S-box-containing protein